MRASGDGSRTPPRERIGASTMALALSVVLVGTIGADRVGAAEGYSRAHRVVAALAPMSTSVAVDADGNLHVAFLEDHAPSRLRYATDRGGWRVETVARRVGFEAQPSIAVAPDGHVVIAFARITCPAEPGGLCEDPADDPLARIMVASNASGSWRVRARSHGPADVWPALAIDAAGRVHIAFQRQLWPPGGPDSGIWHLTNRGGWHETQVASGRGRCHADQLPSIAAGPGGRIWIAYSAARRQGAGCGGSGGIRIATRIDGPWVREIVTTGRDDVAPVVALDRVARPGLIFDRGGVGVRFTRRIGGSWRPHVAVSAGQEGALAFGEDGVAHVAAEGGGGIQVAVGGLAGSSRVTVYRGPLDYGTFGGPGIALHPVSGLERIVFGRSEPDATPLEDELGVYLVRERP